MMTESSTSIKLIIFDLDGVLIDSRPLHYEALNIALGEIDKRYIITLDEHLSRYDGNSTTNKLKMLTEEKGLPTSLYNKIWNIKQAKTSDLIKKLTPDERIISILKTLKEMEYVLYCASNCIWNSVKLFLLCKGFMPYFDYFISNEDVKKHKPSPEMYLKCVYRANVAPHECMILEDSPIGKQSALNSGCHLCEIVNSNDVTLEKILDCIEMSEKRNIINGHNQSVKWNGVMNIVIPMAGYGSRFVDKGYTFPKPLIDVNGKPMIQCVVDNLAINGHYIFLVLREHYEKYRLHHMLNLIAPKCTIICVDTVTQGAACTVLLAKEYINNNEPLIIANSDQYLEWNSSSFIYKMMSDRVSGGISTFTNTHPKWSYVKLDNDGFVAEVREKTAISDKATTGIYFWKKGDDFVKYAEQMIAEDVRHNNEFYVAPVYNQAIKDGLQFKIDDCDRMWGLGTPEDLNFFLSNYKQE